MNSYPLYYNIKFIIKILFILLRILFIKFSISYPACLLCLIQIFKLIIFIIIIRVLLRRRRRFGFLLDSSWQLGLAALPIQTGRCHNLNWLIKRLVTSIVFLIKLLFLTRLHYPKSATQPLPKSYLYLLFISLLVLESRI